MDRRERYEDVIEATMAALDGFQPKLWTAIPAQITQYFPLTNSVWARPTIRQTVRNRYGKTQQLTLPEIRDIPVVFPRGGGFTLTFPIAAGDECLLVFASRCIDLWWVNGGINNQYEQRMHDLSDGFAIVGPWSKPNVIGSISATTTQLRSNDGTMYVDVGPSQIKLHHPTKVLIDAPASEITGTEQVDQAATFETTIDVKGASTLESTLDLKGNALLEQSLQCNGNGQFNGALNSTGILSEAGHEVWTKSTLTSAAQIGGLTSAVTSIGTGPGLNGGPITGAGTIALNIGFNLVGTCVMAALTNAGMATPGTNYAGSGLYYNSSSGILSGTWQCMTGWGIPAPSGCVTYSLQLFQRVM